MKIGGNVTVTEDEQAIRLEHRLERVEVWQPRVQGTTPVHQYICLCDNDDSVGPWTTNRDEAVYLHQAHVSEVIERAESIRRDSIVTLVDTYMGGLAGLRDAITNDQPPPTAPRPTGSPLGNAIRQAVEQAAGRGGDVGTQVIPIAGNVFHHRKTK